MSEFKVTIERVKSLFPIAGADGIEMCELQGLSYSFVVKKGEFQPDDEGIYFPLDAVIPQTILEKIGLVGKLAGSERNRVKTVVLRGQPSQGLFIKKSVLLEGVEVPDDLASYFGVTKYELPEAVLASGEVKGLLPHFLTIYDIESTQRFTTDMEELMASNDVFMVAEKLEGTNHFCGIKEDGEEFVCSRSYELKDSPDSGYWVAARDTNLFEKAREIKKLYDAKTVAIYSELVGPGYQGNHYKLKNRALYTFDIKVDNRWLTPIEFQEVTESLDIITAPILGFKTIKQWLVDCKVDNLTLASNGKSKLNPDVLREGLVYKMVKPRPPFKRIIKTRSPEYLGTTDAI